MPCSEEETTEVNCFEIVFSTSYNLVGALVLILMPCSEEEGPPRLALRRNVCPTSYTGLGREFDGLSLGFLLFLGTGPTAGTRRVLLNSQVSRDPLAAQRCVRITCKIHRRYGSFQKHS